MAAWTSEQVLALSPDAASAKRGKALATVTKWPMLGAAEQVVWGECKGSGKKPYRTAVDLREPAFRCSCPSRKFPCKHAIGLFLLLAEGAPFEESTPPDWVAAWIKKRAESRNTDKRNQAKETKPTADSAAQTRRREKRAANVEAGLADLEQWMQDIVRQGLASIADKPYAFWDGMAARMVDAQAPGVAARVRSLGNLCHSGEGWAERLLKALGELNLLVQGYKQIEQLSPEMKAEVMKQIGFPQQKENLLARARANNPLVVSVEDTWLVLGKVVTQEDSLKTQRVWLWGVRSGQAAVVLSFAHGRRQPLDVSLVPGSSLDASLVFYPGVGQGGKNFRAFVATRTEATAFGEDSADWLTVGAENIGAAIAQYTASLSQNPWLEQFPIILRQALLRYQGQHWYLQDTAGELLPIASHFAQGWELLAMSGGSPLAVFGEWDGRCYLPLSVWSDRKLLVLGE